MCRFKANFEIGFEAPLGFVNRKPVHESIAIAAFILSDLKWDAGLVYKRLDQKQWEYIRGNIWNDDPSCLLLNDSSDDNHDFGIGIDFYDAFINGPPNCMTKRSHFGNLQFLHAMATKVDEPAQVTKDNLMAWLEVMYKLATGEDGYSVDDKLASRLPKDFDASTVPTASDTLKTLIVGTTPSYKDTLFPRRALGICLHIIQDSYAIGHTQRRLLNPEDLADRDQQGYIRFKSGTYGRYGAIIAFHTYPGQNEERHGHYDKAFPATPTPSDLASFNQIIGSRDAIDASTKLVNFWNARTKWDDGVRQFLSDHVFALDPNVQPSNTQVDPVTSGIHAWNHGRRWTEEVDDVACEKAGHYTTPGSRGSFGLDLPRKLDVLEHGVGTAPMSAGAGRPRRTRWTTSSRGSESLKRLLRLLALSVLTLVGMAAALVLGNLVLSRLRSVALH